MTAHSATYDWTSEQTAAKPSRIRSLFAAFRREIEIRRALREVSALDDEMLRDIGLSSGNLEDAVRYGRR